MIAIGSDHGGLNLKKTIVSYFETENISYTDVGTFSCEACDYPDFATMVCDKILKGECETGMLICGTGIGMSIAANRIMGIRAALCHDTFSAKSSKEHNNANVLVLGERVTGVGLALEIVKVFLGSEFSGEERHIKRLDKIEL